MSVPVMHPCDNIFFFTLQALNVFTIKGSLESFFQWMVSEANYLFLITSFKYKVERIPGIKVEYHELSVVTSILL